MSARLSVRQLRRVMSHAQDVGHTGMLSKQDKGKGKADAAMEFTFSKPTTSDFVGPAGGAGPSTPLTSALEEAIETPLSPVSISSSLGRSSFEQASPISRPPEAHQGTAMRPRPPRLLSQLTRSTLPTSTSKYANTERRVTHTGMPSTSSHAASSSKDWRTSPTTALSDDPFPDLDPTTGLPLARRESYDSDAPSLHLQRTITDLLQSPPKESSSYLPFNFALPRVQLPGRPSLDLKRTDTPRSISSTGPQQDWSSWASSWWTGNKGKVDKLMSEDDQADTVEEEVEKHRRKYRSPKHPLVFCHGLLGFDYLGPASLPPLQISHWRGIREVLESNGVDVLITRVPATSSIKERASILEEAIAEKYAGREVNLIGHSMGGLDCRYLVSELRPKSFKPISLTTVSTPHRGSPFADYVIDNFIGRDRLPSLLSLMETLRLPQSGDGTAFEALGTKAMKEFNSTVVNRDDVQYFSWGASFEPGLLDTFRWPHSVILAKEGPNDGLVSVESAKWGDYRGTLLGVNHLDLVGWVNQVRYALSGLTGNPITFKPATFYLEIADYLAEQGY